MPDLSESTSENENMNSDRRPHHAVRIHHSTPNSKHKSRRQYSSSEHLAQKKSHEPVRSEKNSVQRSSRARERDIYEEHSLYNEKTAEQLHRSALRERNGRSTSETRHLPPKGPTKPAREAERRRALSKYVNIYSVVIFLNSKLNAIIFNSTVVIVSWKVLAPKVILVNRALFICMPQPLDTFLSHT